MVEMDTVIGRIGGKVIMTFDFTFCNFMFGLLLDDKTAAEAANKIRALKKRLFAGPTKCGWSEPWEWSEAERPRQTKPRAAVRRRSVNSPVMRRRGVLHYSPIFYSFI
jgi:hypothetical protein